MRKMMMIANKGFSRIANADDKCTAMVIANGVAFELYTLACETKGIAERKEAFEFYENFKKDAKAMWKNM